MNLQNLLQWALRIIAAVILLQTLYFKFTAHPESVALFTKLHAEPWGRIGTGILELMTGVLLLLPKTTIYGALLAIGTMIGAIGSHLLVLGIDTGGDGGLLFVLATIVLLCALGLLWMGRDDLLSLIKKYTGS